MNVPAVGDMYHVFCCVLGDASYWTWPGAAERAPGSAAAVSASGQQVSADCCVLIG